MIEIKVVIVSEDGTLIGELLGKIYNLIWVVVKKKVYKCLKIVEFMHKISAFAYFTVYILCLNKNIFKD